MVAGILSTNNSFQNLLTVMNGQDAGSVMFDSWLTDTMTDPATRDRALLGWSQGPSVRAAHPEADHLLPLMAVAEAAPVETATMDFDETTLSKAISGIGWADSPPARQGASPAS